MLIINCGIVRVVCQRKYHDGAESEEMFRQAGIKLAKVIMIYGEFTAMNKIQQYLESNGYEIMSAKFDRFPNTELKQLSPEDQESVEKLLEKIEEDEDVQNVFHNMAQ